MFITPTPPSISIPPLNHPPSHYPSLPLTLPPSLAPSLLRSLPPFLLPPPPSQMVVEALLATEGFVVTPAMDGPEALQARYDNNA